MVGRTDVKVPIIAMPVLDVFMPSVWAPITGRVVPPYRPS